MNTALALTATNVLGYQAVWLACVGGAGSGAPWLGPLAVSVFAMVMLAAGGKARADLRTLAIAVPIGILLDTAFAASGWMVYAAGWPWASAAPAWIWALWAGFALTLNHSMQFLQARPWLAAVMGLLGGPLAYWAAAGAFDAISFGAPVLWVVPALGLAWAVTLPLLFTLNRRLAAPKVTPA